MALEAPMEDSYSIEAVEVRMQDADSQQSGDSPLPMALEATMDDLCSMEGGHSPLSNWTHLSLDLVDPDLLRCIRTQSFLSNGGKELCTRKEGGIGSVVSNGADKFCRSFPVKEVDIFLSHSWHANWILKFIALLFYFNGIPALVSAALTGMLTLALLWRWREPIQDDGVVTFSPPHLVCFSAGIAAYVVVIFTWHHVSAQLPTRMGGQTVFMDKLCISQTDMKKKERGIRSIGGILRRSRLMLVAWDRSYFSRLWCTFEMSVFVHAMPHASVDLIPICFGSLIVVLLVGDVCVEVAVVVLAHCRFQFVSAEVTQNIYLFMWFCTTIVCAWIIRNCLEDADQLQKQLSEFRIQDVECFCCKCNHIHPDSGVTIPCDRMLVYSFLQRCHGNTASIEEALEEFNARVQTTFRDIVLRSVRGATNLKYSLAVTVGVFSGLASLDWSLCSNISEWYTMWRFVYWSIFALPIALAGTISIAQRCCYIPTSFVMKRLFECGIAALFVALLEALTVIDRKAGREGTWALGWLACEVAMVWLLYRGPCSGNH